MFSDIETLTAELLVIRCIRSVSLDSITLNLESGWHAVNNRTFALHCCSRLDNKNKTSVFQILNICEFIGPNIPQIPASD